MREHFKDLIGLFLEINFEASSFANLEIGNIIEQPIEKISSVKKGENKNQKETVYKKLVKIKEKKIHQENQKNKEKQEFNRKMEIMGKEKEKEKEAEKSDPNFVEQKQESKKNNSKSNPYKSHLNSNFEFTKNSEKKMDSEYSTESFIKKFFPKEKFFELDQNIQNLKYNSKSVRTPFISTSSFIKFKANLDLYYSRDKSVTEKQKEEAKNKAIEDINARLEKMRKDEKK